MKLSDLEKIPTKQKGLSAGTHVESEVLDSIPFEALTAPDWLSLHEEDWTFFGPTSKHVKVQT